MSSDPVLVTDAEVLAEATDGVLTLTLNRPDRLNAWTPTMAALYAKHLDDADADPAVRAIVVTGAGRGFCAGGDMGLKAEGRDVAASLPEPYVGVLRPLRIRKPVIAAINGPCAGAGFTLALACDIRFAAPGTKLSSSFVRRGRIGTPGLPWLLSRIVGSSDAMDLLLSGRVFLAEEAFRMGLLTRVSAGPDVLGEAHAYARELVAECSPRAMAGVKRALLRALEHGFDDAVAEGAALLGASREWPDAAEGTRSYSERRRPAYRPLPPAEGTSDRSW